MERAREIKEGIWGGSKSVFSNLGYLLKPSEKVLKGSGAWACPPKSLTTSSTGDYDISQD